MQIKTQRQKKKKGMKKSKHQCATETLVVYLWLDSLERDTILDEPSRKITSGLERRC